MKTLYIDINNKPIENTDEVMCFSDNGSLQNDFFYELGCSLLSKSGVNVPKAQLISEFKTSGNDEAYNKIVSQWDSLKTIIFGEEVEGTFDVHLPKEYISWLSTNQNQEYRALCTNKGYDVTNELVITIDVEEFYDEYIDEDFRRSIVKVLKENTDIEQIVFNDDAVTRKSLIVKRIRKEFEGMKFTSWEKYIDDGGETGSNGGNGSGENKACFKYAIQEVTDDFYSIIDIDGNIVLEDIDIYNNGFAIANGILYKISNDQGISELVFEGHHGISIKHDPDIRPFANERLTICKLDNGKVLVYDENRNLILNKMLDDAKYDVDDTLLIKEGSNWGVYDNKAKKYIIAPQFKEMNSLYRGHYAVTKLIDGEIKWGVINSEKEELYPFENDEIIAITVQKEYACLVERQETKYGVIKYDSTDRHMIIPFKYDYIEQLSDTVEEYRGISFFECHEGKNTIRKSVIDSEGEEIIPPTWEIDWIHVDESQIIAYPTSYDYDEITGEIAYYPTKNLRAGVTISGTSVYDSNMEIIYSTSYDKYLRIVYDKYIIESSNSRGLEKDTFKLIDLKGRVLCILEGKWLHEIGNDLFAFRTCKRKTKVIDKLDNTKYDLGDSGVPAISEGRIYYIEPKEKLFSKQKNSVLKCIDTNGDTSVVIDFEKEYIMGNFIKPNLLELRNGDARGLFNIQNKKMMFDFGNWSFIDRGNYLEVSTGSARTYYDLNGNKIFNSNGKSLWVI